MAGSRIFISYRHADSAGWAGRLYDRLSTRYGDEQIFMDLQMEYGIDFVDRIEDAVGSCAVMLVMIGPGWLDARDGANRRRLDDADDFVRIEVTSALARSTRVIPVLVGDAGMPGNDDLPPALRKLARRNALELSNSRWDYDVSRLVETVDGVINDREQRAAQQPKATVAAGAPVLTPPRPRATASPAPARTPPGSDPASPPGSQKVAPRRPRAALVAAAGVAVAAVVIAVILLAGSGGGQAKGPSNTVTLGKGTEPVALAVNRVTRTLWIAENAKGVVAEAQLSLGGMKVIRTIGLRGAHPTRVVTAGRRVLWLSDPDGGRIVHVDIASGQVKLITLPDGGKPRGIALDNTGHLLVVDSANSRVIQMEASGSVLHTWPIEGQQLHGQQLRSIILGQPGIAWISDPGDAKVIRLDMGHAYVTVLDIGGSPAGLARDPGSGNIWVADSARNQIIRIDRITRSSDAEPQASDFSTDVRAPVGDAPAAIAIDDRMIWVANADADTVTVLSYKKPYERLADDFTASGRPVAITAAGTRAWVASQLGGTVSQLSATPR